MNAPSANPLSRQILVLHKSAGHVRIALPAMLANPGSAAVIESALLRILKALWITAVVTAGFGLLFGITGAVITLGGTFLHRMILFDMCH